MYRLDYVEPEFLGSGKPGWTIKMCCLKKHGEIRRSERGFVWVEKTTRGLTAFFTCPRCRRISHLPISGGSVREVPSKKGRRRIGYDMSGDEGGCFTCLRCMKCRRKIMIYLDGFVRRWLSERVRIGSYYRYLDRSGRYEHHHKGLGKFLTEKEINRHVRFHKARFKRIKKVFSMAEASRKKPRKRKKGEN